MISLTDQLRAARLASKDVDAAFTRFFEALGYRVDLDGTTTPLELWHEIYDDDGLFLQVQTGTPIAEFLADLPAFVDGRPGSGQTTYWCACKDDAKLRALHQRVIERQEVP
jgi:hypothetical protein